MSLRIGSVDVLIDDDSILWTSGMEIDADGAPNAYAPGGSGLVTLDALANAGHEHDWYGLACDANGEPFVQSSDDPNPGYFVSTTALFDPTKVESDPLRYVNSAAVPYISVPRAILVAGAKKGDLCSVTYNGTKCGAIIADVGPAGAIGEGSIALAQALVVNPFRGLPKHRLLGIDSGVSFRILLRTASAPPWPRDIAEISNLGSFA
jgi:hypothetical protein